MDRISDLPYDIVIHVLSFLTPKQSARTSILSKSWMNISSSVIRQRPIFDYEEMKLIKEEDILPEAKNNVWRSERLADLPGLMKRFVECVNCVLRSWEKPEEMDEFRIRFELDASFQNDINNWLEFAFARKLQTLELDMLIDCHNYAGAFNIYGFPNRIIDQTSNESSKESPPLSPNHYFDQNNYVLRIRCFDSLRSLSLARVSVSGEVISFFLNKCRNLERVKVCLSRTLINLEVCGTFPALKYLEICHCSYLTNISVRDTNLVSLKLNRVSMLENNSKLVQVCLASDPAHEFGKLLLPLLVSSSLSRVQILTLDVSYFDAAELADQVTRVPQLGELRQLTLNVQHKKPQSLMHLTSLISLSPNLEKFILQAERRYEICMEDRPLVKGPKLVLQYLKTVELRGYYGHEMDNELIMFFVENATCLETVIIDPRGLLTYPHVRDLLSEKQSIELANRLKEMIPSSSSVKLTIKESTMQEYPCW